MKETAKKKLKVALVHDYLAEYGGAERVIEALHQIFPNAPLYTAFVDKERLGTNWQRFKDWQIHESWLTQIPFHKKLFSPLRVFAPNYFKSFDLSEYDLVVSSTNAYFAKAVTVNNKQKHFCYCHTPARSLWGYTTQTNWKKNPVTKFFGTLINHYLRVVDVKVARCNVGTFIANSEETRRRITKFYKLPSKVIYPPINLKLPKKLESSDKRSYYLYVNRLALAKHPELAVKVAGKLKLPLKVVGTGKMRSQLEKIAGGSVEFLGFVSDSQLQKLYANARALIYPVEDEDFGIVPIEAMAFGTSVIAHASGGPLETVVDGKNGVLFDELNEVGLEKAIKRLEKLKLKPKDVQASIKKFLDKDRFKKELINLVSHQ